MRSRPLPRPLIGLALLILAGGCASPMGSGVTEVQQVARLDTPPAREAVPPDDDAWATAPVVALPDFWPTRRRVAAAGAWYHTAVSVDAHPAEPMAIFIPHAVMSATVWVNGVRVAASPLRNVNRPMLADISPAVLRPGRNVIDVRLRVPPTYRSYLAPFFVGPERQLRRHFAVHLFWREQAVELSVFLTFAFGAFALTLWVRRRKLPGFAECAIACLLWAVAMMEFVVRNPVVPELVWQWTVATAMVGSLATFTIGARRFLGTGSTRLDVLVALVWAAGATAFAIVLALERPVLADAVLFVWAAGAGAIGCLLLAFTVRIGWSSKADSLRVVVPIGCIGFLVGVRDVALGLGIQVGPPAVLLPYLGSVVAIWGGWRVVERFISTLDESEALNRDLEQRVHQRGAEIALGYERIHRLERERAIQDERARLMRDIHDGFGGQLTSMLALVERTEASHNDVADALRNALDDMRLVVYSLGPHDADLVGLLASWRARIERRLQQHDLRFDWQVSDLPPLPWLGPREALHVLRVFQEAISNVMQHARASTITVRTGSRSGDDGRDGVYLEVDDNGAGLAVDARVGAGAGLGNMAQRARELGGRVSLTNTGGGTRVELWLPLEPTAPRARATD